MEQKILKNEISIQELTAFINESKEEFLISIELGGEADINAKEEPIQG
ncbi:hypothetical protein acsn021_39190 [Anaerocolumna cellulosilytica]|uniref:Uncharacterized protein n=1 Tax=Anaerocolumna cellulosilytica TaxID=433286 RepID=A0A6S6RA42_9FIRM|nr:hypothetical protein [Anaerocolumna cellulosilytica]MBB5196322.1 hypothetical protein [Anaerocolumna cellulosilytica]BCJ96350.1 hypothetical protein acsn021_39190 [Anaerocolumna cellulosilytica]